nr:YjbF family lipoprotein [Vibrio paracholerae]
MHRLYYLAFCQLFLIMGCSNSSQHLSETMQLAIFGTPAPVISPQKVAGIPYASLYIQQNDNPLALMVLGWAEPTRNNRHPALKWVSAGQEMLVTEGGRITKTLNLDGANLISLESDSTDPLLLGLHRASTPREWHFYLSWQPGYHFRYLAHSQFITLGEQQKQLPNGESRTLLRIDEQITIAALNQQYHNQYWLEPSTGAVIASEQQLAPGTHRYALTVAKSYLNQGGI